MTRHCRATRQLSTLPEPRVAVAETHNDGTSLVENIHKIRFSEKFIRALQHHTGRYISDALLRELGISIIPIDFYTGQSVNNTSIKPLLIPMSPTKVQHHLENPTISTENNQRNTTRDPAGQFCCNISEYMFLFSMDRDQDSLMGNTHGTAMSK